MDPATSVCQGVRLLSAYERIAPGLAGQFKKLCCYEKSGAFFEKPEQIKKGTAVFAFQAVATTANAGDLFLNIKSHLWTDSFSRSHFRVNHGTSTIVNMD